MSKNFAEGSGKTFSYYQSQEILLIRLPQGSIVITIWKDSLEELVSVFVRESVLFTCSFFYYFRCVQEQLS